MKLKQIRGDTWYDDARRARCAFRFRLSPGYHSNDVGFRCCFSPLDKRKVRNKI